MTEVQLMDLLAREKKSDVAPNASALYVLTF